MRGTLALGVSIITIALVAEARGQDAGEAQQDGSATVLQTITITAGRAPQQISQTAKTVHVVEADEIQSRARSGESLQQILAAEIPSFDAASYGARSSYGQNLRGRTALVLIDGVSLNSARGVSRQFDSIDPFNIERVEVLSGATAIYGGNATGGIINIITKKGKDAQDGLHAEITTGVESGFRGSGDFDRSGSAAVTYNKDDWDARFSVSTSRTGNYYDGSGTLLVPDITQTSTASTQRIDVMGSIGYQIDASRRFEIGGQYYDSEQSSDYGIYFGQNLAAIRNPRLFETRDGYSSDFDPATRRAMVNATYTDDDFLGQNLLLQGFYRSERVQFHPFPSSTYFFGSSQDTDYYGFKAAMVSEPADRLKLTYGIDADRDSFSSSQNIFDMLTAMRSGALDFDTIGVTGLYPKIDVSTIAGFVDVSYELTDALTLSGGARYQHVYTNVGDFVGAVQQVAILQGTAQSADAIAGGSVNYDAFLFNAGATYSLSDTQQVYTNFAQGFELPDPAKYYGVGTYTLSGGHYSLLRSVNVAQSALEAIKPNSFELGYRFDDGTYNAAAAAFYSLSDRSISLNRTTLAIEMQDQERRVYGFEGKVGAKLSHGLDVGMLGQWVKTEVKDPSGWSRYTVGSASVPKLGGHVGWAGDALSLRLQGEHIFDLADDAGYSIKGYTLFNLTGAYKFEAANATVNFGVHNLFDKDYTTIWGSRAKALYGGLADESIFDYKGRGRTFAVSLTKTF
ncbi:TonB-dependent receptor [Agrobacterium sp. SORGH_AS 787]|uniref:TonB-dependent receptor n=1 Tax=Agrobacterium sp. SORGH_AS 787 TaxID=3041775 RepID=UPI002781FA10|nr:iron complex outermembrane receptor protein [Rhizobium sp. SORGH_AS_0787]